MIKKILKTIYYLLYEILVKFNSIKGEKEISKIYNTHNGEKCFIVCTGPSLTIEDLELIKDEFSISMNSIVNVFEKTKYRPNVYIIQDPFVFEKLRKDSLLEKIKDLDSYFGSIIKYKNPKLKLSGKIFNLSLLGHNLMKNKKQNFSEDFSKIVYDGFSVTYSAIQLAVYMGFKDIYLLGNDCNYSSEKKHFDNYGDKDFVYDNTAENMLSAYKYLNKKMSELDFNIYNATRGGKLEIFPRIQLERAVKYENSSNSTNEIK